MEVPTLYLRDGIDDCGDGSDEASDEASAMIAPAPDAASRSDYTMSHYYTMRVNDFDLATAESLGHRTYVEDWPAIRYAEGNEHVEVEVYHLKHISVATEEDKKGEETASMMSGREDLAR